MIRVEIAIRLRWQVKMNKEDDWEMNDVICNVDKNGDWCFLKDGGGMMKKKKHTHTHFWKVFLYALTVQGNQQTDLSTYYRKSTHECRSTGLCLLKTLSVSGMAFKSIPLYKMLAGWKSNNKLPRNGSGCTCCLTTIGQLLVWFYGTSNKLGYLIPNPLYIYIYIYIYKGFGIKSYIYMISKNIL